MIETYRPSGQFNVSFLVLGLVGAVAAGVLGLVYQKLIGWIPFIYLNALCTAGAGAVLMGATGMLVEKGKCRSAALALSVGLLMVVVLLGASHWMAWQDWQSDVEDNLQAEIASKDEIPAADRASVLDEWMTELRETGELAFGPYVDVRVEFGWEIGRSGAPVSGAFVWLVWIIEVCALGVGVFIGSRYPRNNPFSETHDEWANVPREHCAIDRPSAGLVSAVRGARDTQALFPDGAPERTGGVGTALVYSLKGIPDRDDELWLDVVHVSVQKGKKGDETKSKVIWGNVRVGPSERTAYERLCAALDAEPEPSPGSDAPPAPEESGA